MSATREIRADYDRDTIVVYQAYSDAIATPALREQRFVAPFSFERMTWSKPSFLWLMHRSNWGRKKGQERTLRVRLSRAGWDEALSLGVLTSPDGPVFGNAARWRAELDEALVQVQWDTERSLRGAPRDHLSIQVGLSRHVIERFVDRWIVSIEDFTATAARIHRQLRDGNAKQAVRALPDERIYPVEAKTAKRLWLG